MNRPSARRVASALASVLAVVVVAAFVVQAVPAVVGADASYVVLSGSMEPEISPGDAVVVKDVDPASIDEGDVVTFVRAGESTPVTHRVVEVLDREDGLAFRTKGDANSDPDPQPVPAENVTGEVWFVLPLVGHVVLFANTPTGIAVLVGLPVAAFLVSELYAFAASGGGETTADESVDGPAPDARDAPADAASAADAAVEAESDAFTVTSTDLRLTGVTFATFTAYSGYVAYQRPTPVHVGVLAGAVTVLALVGTVLLFGGGPSGESGDVNAERPDAATDGGAADAGFDGGDGGDA
ncbi:signal peptidase I [Halobacterium yunchengense]|uniref:signal peptidase I n=1 Tax=Halobacterium yunchengense TaxID=3108497 RepID=UPI00300B64C4